MSLARGEAKYTDTRFNITTSNKEESRFPRGGYAFNDHRQALLPTTLEA